MNKKKFKEITNTFRKQQKEIEKTKKEMEKAFTDHIKIKMKKDFQNLQILFKKPITEIKVYNQRNEYNDYYDIVEINSKDETIKFLIDYDTEKETQLSLENTDSTFMDINIMNKKMPDIKHETANKIRKSAEEIFNEYPYIETIYL